MAKRIIVNVGTIGLALVIIIGVLYYYFPKIWGDVLFPLDYQELIIKYSKEYNLDPAFVAAVIYSESHYDPEATSRAGARGLMQIMPATGASIAGRIGDKNYSPDKLYEPETNIRYGCWYLRYLLDDYKGDKNTALAGYNGGGAVGDRYVVSREAGIPQETKGYINTVLFAEEMYLKLYPTELYIQNPENVAEKLKLPALELTLWEKMINFIKEKISGL